MLQDVLRFDAMQTVRLRVESCPLEHRPRPWRQRNESTRQCPTDPDEFAGCHMHRASVEPALGQLCEGVPVAFIEQPHEQMLGAEIAVPENARLLLGERDDLARARRQQIWGADRGRPRIEMRHTRILHPGDEPAGG